MSSALERTRVALDPWWVGVPEKACTPPPPPACCLVPSRPPTPPAASEPPHQVSTRAPRPRMPPAAPGSVAPWQRSGGPACTLWTVLPQIHHHPLLSPFSHLYASMQSFPPETPSLLSNWRNLPLEAGKINTLTTLLRGFPFC